MAAGSGKRRPLASALVALFALMAVGCLAGAPRARAQDCARGDFEAVVSEAASKLRDLNARNKPTFQAKLRELSAIKY